MMATYSKFEDIKHTNEIEQEYWSTKESYEVADEDVALKVLQVAEEKVKYNKLIENRNK